VTVAVNNRSYALPEPVTTDLNRLIDASPDRFPPEDGSSQYRLTAPLDEPILQDRENVRRVRRNAPYPRLARTQKIQGVVRVEFVIRKNGTPTRLRLAQRAHPFLDKAALDAIRRTTFNPVRVGGTRINLAVSVPITFRLEPDRVPRNAP
jgi:TonB family protein